MSDVTATFGSLNSTESSNSPSGGTVIGSGLDDNLRMMQAHVAAWRDQTAWGILNLTTVAGTNTITATVATAGSVTFGPTSLATGMKFYLVPANTNTGATTLNITSPNGGSALGAKNVFSNGAACVGGEFIQNVPAVVAYDGTQFHIFGSRQATTTVAGDSELATQAEYDAGTASRVPTTDLNKISLGNEQASTSGTAITFTGIPAGTRRIIISLIDVSTNGTSDLLVQIGDAGGLETTGYKSTASLDTGATRTTSTAGFVLSARADASAASIFYGQVTLILEDSSDFTWTSTDNLGTDVVTHNGAGRKSLSAVLDRVSLTSVSGDTFDAGSVNIAYER